MSVNVVFIWWNAWKHAVQHAKENPDMREFYCRHAQLAQAEYLMHSVLYWSAIKP